MSTMTSDSGSQATSNSMPESERKYFQIRSIYSSSLLFLMGQGAYIRTYVYVHYGSGVGNVFHTYTVHADIRMEHEGPSMALCGVMLYTVCA